MEKALFICDKAFDFVLTYHMKCLLTRNKRRENI